MDGNNHRQLQQLELELHQPLSLAATIVEEELELWHHCCL
jgi:hypothetical protein